MRQLERALDQAGLGIEHVRLLVCTHAHSDHYGLAAPIMERSGCELWMHPNHAHMTRAAQDPERAFERRFEVARQSGVPAAAGGRGDGGAPRTGLRHRRDRDARPRAAARRGGRYRPGRVAGLRDARPRALARGAAPARARPAAVRRPPARPRVALLRLRVLARPGGRVPVEPRRGRRPRRAVGACRPRAPGARGAGADRGEPARRARACRPRAPARSPAARGRPTRSCPTCSTPRCRPA